MRDSAGIEIVENHAPERPLGRFWTMDPEPGFVLGSSGGPGGSAAQGNRDDHDGRIWEVVGLARLVDGRIAVLSQGNHQLFIFEASGRLSRTIGGRGQGPGEFVRPERLQYLPPDTLVVWDYWMGSVTSFDTTGAMLDHRRVDLGRVLASVPGASAEAPTTPLPDGSFVMTVRRRDLGSERPRAGALVRHPPLEYVKIDLDTYVARSLGIWDGEELWAASSDVVAVYPELRENVDGLVSFDGQLTSHVAGGGRPPAIYATNGDRNEIRQFSLQGDLMRVIRRTTAPPVVTDRAHRAWQDYALALGAGEYGVEEWPKRERHPAVAGLAVDAAGYLWVREWSESESGMPDQWSVFGPEGRWLGVASWVPLLAVCSGLPCWIDREWLVILTGDALGRARIEGYRIHRNGVEELRPGRPDILPEVGEVFRDCEACPMMMVVPGGSFLMGSPESETEGSAAGVDGEQPRHPVTIGAPFSIGVFEVSFAEWEACVRAGGCDGHVPDDEGWGRGRRPVINVSWFEARAYVEWLSTETGERYRLPSEAEWEYAARGGTETKRHWGDNPSGQCRYANGYDLDADAVLPPSPDPGFRPVDCRDGHVHTAPVGSFAPNPFGLYDILGNVAEWTEDCWGSHRDPGRDTKVAFKGYDGAPDDGSAWTEGSCDGRVVRGGGWGSQPRSIRSASRFPQDAPPPQDANVGPTEYALQMINMALGGRGRVHSRSEGVGFRVARTIVEGRW